MIPLRLQHAAWYAAMPLLETYGRVRGVYRGRYAPGPAIAPQAATWKVDGLVQCVAFVGDSLTAGHGVNDGQAFPAQLKQLGWPVGPIAASDGLTTQSGLQLWSTMAPTLAGRAGTLVLVCLGGNDLMQRLPTGEVFTRLAVLLEAISSAGHTPVVLGLRGSWLFHVDYVAPFRELAARTGAGLIPCILDGIWGNLWLMTDAAHPNARGHRALAARLDAVWRDQWGWCPALAAALPAPVAD